MVWHELTHHLEVVWGALVALVIVVALTPAVGGMARLLGVVDRPEGGRRPNPRGVPRLGGLALFMGVFVSALAFLPLGREMRGILLGAAVATTVGVIDDFRGLRWWEKLSGQVFAAAIVVWSGVWVHSFTFPLIGVHALPFAVGQWPWLAPDSGRDAYSPKVVQQPCPPHCHHLNIGQTILLGRCGGQAGDSSGMADSEG